MDARILDIWREGRSRTPRFAFMFVAGIAALLVLVFAPVPTLKSTRQAADDSADWVIRFSERATGRLDNAPAFAFIDIDDQTWSEWGSPLITPRDRIAALIERLEGSGALAIVLDIDLAYPDAPEREAILRRTLETYPPQAPALLLVRNLVPPTPGNTLPSPRSTAYDNVLEGKPNVAWGTPSFGLDDDGRVRRWLLYVPVCGELGPAVVPSLHLAAAILARHAGSGEARQDTLVAMQDRLAPLVPESCGGIGESRTVIVDAEPAAHPIVVETTDAGTRVLYRVAWEPGAVALGPTVTTAAGDHVPMVAVRPASLVERIPAGDAMPGLDGRIVLVGGSFADSGDWHATPLGRMPGALVVMNAISTLASVGAPRDPSTLARLAIGTIVVLVSAVALSYLRAIVAGFVVAGLAALLLVFSAAWFGSGVLADLAVPALAVAVAAMLAEMRESFAAIRGLGWRWLLKPGTETARPSAGPPGTAKPEDAAS